jgi:hypothetical protein
MKIRLTVNGKAITATLNGGKSALDFVSLLPLTLTLEDFNSTEKISYLPKKLTSEGAPASCTPSSGDITYYAPWGNLAIFYRNFRLSSGLVMLGKIDSGKELFDVSGSVNVLIEVVK